MATIADMITQLQDTNNKDKRREAAEGLRVAPSLPPGAIAALRSAVYDPEASVAESARAALAVHDPPPSTVAPQAESPSPIPKGQATPAWVNPLHDFSARGRGLIICIVCAAFGYAEVYQPVSRALNHAPGVSWNPAFVGLVSIGLLSGALIMVFGQLDIVTLLKRKLLSMVLFIVISIVVFLASIESMKLLMKMLGYG